MKMNLLFIGIVFVGIMQWELTYSQENVNDKPGSDWPQWRGPNRDGISLEKSIIKNWPADGPEILWRKPIGEGYSGIAVSNSKIFSMWDEANSQYLVCLDDQDGNELWRYRVDSNYVSTWGDGPLVTPIVDQMTVYAISTHGFLHAVNINNGKVIWSQNLSDKYGYEPPPYGYAVSPLIENEKLFIEMGGKENFTFAALNKYTGELIWNSQTDDAAYSSPIAITVNNKRQIVYMSAKGLFSVSPDDGRLLWEYYSEARCPSTGISLNSVSPFFIAPDKIFISGGHSTPGGALLQVIKEGEEFAINTLWESEEMKNEINSSVYFENHIYGFDRKTLKCINTISGEVKWEKKGFNFGSLIIADGHLIVLGERGKLALVEANPNEYNEIAIAQVLTGRSWTSPSLANGKLYLRNQKELISIEIIENNQPLSKI